VAAVFELGLAHKKDSNGLAILLLIDDPCAEHTQNNQ
jgi:hypothetical protein